ncbi:hypothetical protein [Nesterenkonia sp.]|uniref:hypothetical protein n=1 Tax=Nesterenkonia sp. TaxID=704201 RepID=UPI002624A200|nr:hypothetical protein [Nesterenkonia sp.]
MRKVVRRSRRRHLYPAQRPSLADAWSQLKSERGAGNLEYLGIAVTAAVVVLALALVPWLPQVTATFHNVICSIAANVPGTGGSCEGGGLMTEEDFQPDQCMLSRGAQSASLDGSVLFLEGSDGASMVVEELSDGTYAVTYMDDSAVGASLDLLKLNAGPLLDVGLGAGFMDHMNLGETRVFDSEAEAMAFAEEVQNYVDANGSYWKMGGMFHSPPGEDIPPQITREVMRTEGFANANAQVGPSVGGKKKNRNNNDQGDSEGDSGSSGGDSSGGATGQDGSDDSLGFNADWLPQLSAGGSISDEAIIEVDHGEDLDDPSDDTTSIIFGTQQSGDASGNFFSWNDQTQRGSSESMTIDVDADGEITGITLREGSVTSDTDYQDADYESTTWTTEISVDSEHEREIVEAWLEGGEDIPSAEGVREAPTQDGSPQSDFEQLLYTSGVTSHETHAGTSEEGGWGIGAKLASIGGGFGKSTSSSSEQLVDAGYLAPPDTPGGTRSIEETPC